jgi:amidase
MPLPGKTDSFFVHMAQAGPLARNPEDLELLWKIIVGPHISDRTTPDINWKDPVKKSLSEFRIAWTDGWPDHETSTQITGLLHSFAGELEKTGCRVEKQIPDQTLHHESLLTYVEIFPYVIAQGTPWIIRKIIKMQLYRGLLKGLKNQYPDLKKSMNDAFRMNARHYTRMMLSRNRITRRWEEFFTEYDFLVCPVAFGPAFRRCKTGSKIHYNNKELLYLDYVWPFAACFNASGNPSIAVPLGLNEDGLPVGVQIVGKYWSEPQLIHFVKLLQPYLPGFIRPKGFE